MVEIKVGLVVFGGREILLEDRGGLMAIPECPLPEYRTSYYLVKEILNKTTFITGSWASVEFGLRQVGVFDDLDRNPNGREIIIIYSLYIPATTKIKEGYKWVKIEDLRSCSFYLDHENIIRFCATGERKNYE